MAIEIYNWNIKSNGEHIGKYLSKHKSIANARKAAIKYIGKSRKGVVFVDETTGKTVGVATYTDGSLFYPNNPLKAVRHTGWYFNHIGTQYASGWINTDGNLDQREQ